METIKLNIPKVNLQTIKKPSVIYEGESIKEVVNQLEPIQHDTKYGAVSIQGNSVVWNQLVNHNHWTSTTNNGVTFIVEDGGEKIIVNGTATGLARIMVNPYFGLKANHKYALTGAPNNANGATLRYFGTGVSDKGDGCIISPTTDAYNALAVEVTEGLTVNNAIFYPKLTDLTQMFGAGNEPTTIEEFEKRKPIGVTNDYNEGEIISYQQWGESVVWNQLNKTFTINTLQSNSSNRAYKAVTLNKVLPINHKLLATCKSTLTTIDEIPDIKYKMYIGTSTGTFNQQSPEYSNGNTSYFFVTPNTDTRKTVGVRYIGAPVEGDTLLVENIYVYDLTLMFGEGNEPTTIEEFERRRPRNVTNEYNEGTEINGDIEIKTVGLNQWDEEWEAGTINSATGANAASNLSLRSKNFISVIGSGKYKYVAPYSSVITRYAIIFTYDNNKQFIQTLSNIRNGSIVTMPTDACYCKIKHQYYIQDYGTYNNDICLHLAQDGLVSQYKPYTSTTTPLPNVTLIKDADGNPLFPYGLCSAGSVYDEITETKAIKRVGVVDMGTLSYQYRTQEKDFLSNVFSPNPKYIGETLCAIYRNNKAINATGQNNKTVRLTNTYKVIVRDSSYTSADDFKAAMQGVLLYYELAEPIEVDIDKWNNKYKIQEGGTIKLTYGDVNLLTTPLNSSTQLGNYIPLTPYQLAYGVEFNTTNSSPICKRIGNMTMHKTLPIHNQIKGCLLDDDGNVIEYLPENDWTTATRDGSNGQVMVEIPEHYRKFVTQENKRQIWISQYPIQGFHKVNKCYVSAYEASLQRSTLKLSSVVNTTTDYRGGNNNANWDDTYRTLCGMPVTSISRTNFRKYARNRKTTTTEWNCMTYDMQKTLYWLFVTEYATLNTQTAYNSTLTAEGFKQGGLGVGVTTLNSDLWNTYNSYNPFIPCGYTDSLGNNTGVITFTMPEEYNTTLVNVSVPRYRGIENPFGHIWQWTDGINVRISPTEENGGDGLSKVFICNDPSKFNDSNYTGYTYVGNEARTEKYVTEVIFGEYGEIMPKTVGGSSTTYFCDYHYTSIPTKETLRGVLFGGNAIYSVYAGFVCAYLYNAPSITSAHFGSRLCFYSQNNV